MLYNLTYKTRNDITDLILGLSEENLKQFINDLHAKEEYFLFHGDEFFISKISNIKIFDSSKLKTDLHKKSTIDQIVQTKVKEIWFSDTYEAGIEILPLIGNDVTENYLSTNTFRDTRKNSKNNVMKNHNDFRIFISHSTKDKEIVDEFCDKILHFVLNIDTTKSVFCTSLAGRKPLSGEDFRDRIKSELTKSTYVLQFISKNYKSSEVCLNEMGAAWVLNTKIIPLALEPGEYDVGFINKTTQQVQLHKKSSILELIDLIAKEQNFNTASHSITNDKIDSFIKIINNFYPSK
jgi:hypothetical protein